MRKQLAAFALLTALTIPGAAQGAAIVNFTNTTAIPGNNDFQGLLNAHGLTRYATTGGSITLDVASNITFYYMAAESAYNDTFSAVSTPNFSLLETADANNFASPVFIGTGLFGAGSLAGRLNFTSNIGAPATVGQDGFAIFLGPNQVSGAAVSSFFIGYDDQITNQDDNHDDLIVYATVESAVPEPATWAMMLVGFGAVGAAIRRRRATAGGTLAIA